jgi:glycosyltransferase involved in cell wall biosynthesis
MDSPSRRSPLAARRSVALCLTVLDEAGSVDELFASIAAQSRPPDRIVVADGGSIDDTVAAAAAWRDRGLPVEVLVCPGANISAGRNAAIGHVRADLIAVTDGGVRLDRGWLASLIAPFESPDPPDVVAGFFRPDPRSTFELALGATTLPAREDLRPERFLPSSRSVAFTRAAWERVGGYPEWLDYCEDLVFDLALRAAGFRFHWAPDAVVYFRPRPTAGAFFRQYYRYARGDGKADLWRKRHAIRYAIYLGLPLLLALARTRPWLLAPLALAAAGYVRRPYARLWPGLGPLPARQRAVAIAWVPLIRLIGDVAKMVGYPPGVAWRWKRRRSPARPPAQSRGERSVDERLLGTTHPR